MKVLLTHKQLEICGYILSLVATDVLVPTHWAISIQSTDKTDIVLDQFQDKIVHL